MRGEGRGQVRTANDVGRLDEPVDFRKKPLGELIELGFTHLIGRDLDECVVSSLRPRADRDTTQYAMIGPPARRLLRRRQAAAEEALGDVQDGFGTRASSVEVPHALPLLAF